MGSYISHNLIHPIEYINTKKGELALNNKTQDFKDIYNIIDKNKLEIKEGEVIGLKGLFSYLFKILNTNDFSEYDIEKGKHLTYFFYKKNIKSKIYYTLFFRSELNDIEEYKINLILNMMFKTITKDELKYNNNQIFEEHIKYLTPAKFATDKVNYATIKISYDMIYTDYFDEKELILDSIFAPHYI